MLKILFRVAMVLATSACGSSGGDSTDAIVFEGQLTQGTGGDHTERSKHEIGEPIEKVNICALGRCSTTDEQGTFGFSAPDSFRGGDIEFSINGHFTEASVLLTIPQNAKDVVLHFQKQSSTNVTLHHLTVDGNTIEATEGN